MPFISCIIVGASPSSTVLNRSGESDHLCQRTPARHLYPPLPLPERSRRPTAASLTTASAPPITVPATPLDLQPPPGCGPPTCGCIDGWVSLKSLVYCTDTFLGYGKLVNCKSKGREKRTLSTMILMSPYSEFFDIS